MKLREWQETIPMERTPDGLRTTETFNLAPGDSADFLIDPTTLSAVCVVTHVSLLQRMRTRLVATFRRDEK